jgi:phosphate transport system permease protein
MSKPTESRNSIEIVNRGLARRYGAERRFRLYGQVAIVVSLFFLAILFATIFSRGYSAFQQTFVQLEIEFDPALIDRENPAGSDFGALVKAALAKEFPEVTSRLERRRLNGLISSGAAFTLQKMVTAHPGLIGSSREIWVEADDDVDMLIKGHVLRQVPESDRRLDDRQLDWIEKLEREGKIRKQFNWTFFTSGDSREPELAGIWGAFVGSMLTLALTLAISFPVGVSSAVYLEEFAPRNRLVDLVEVNINNLAAVPSIIFGLLGLAIFINFFHLPRSSPLIGGLVLTLMTLPTIIIASRASLQSVPPSIREAALGIGASKMQVVLHHVLPLAMPGMLTGTIIGMARALGETAPLLMIGMVAFIVDIPGSFVDPATVLPVQIFLWADSPERAFVERTSAAIMVLLAFLVVMNSLAVFLRNRFERRW